MMRRRPIRQEGSLWPFTIGVIVLLAVAGFFAYFYVLGNSIPYPLSDYLPEKEAEIVPAVDPQSVEAREFDLNGDLLFYYVDAARGPVPTENMGRIPESSLGAVALESRADPSPPGVYFVANLHDADDTVIVEPTDAEGYRQAVMPLAMGKFTAYSVALEAELMTDSIVLSKGPKEARARKARKALDDGPVIEGINFNPHWLRSFRPY